MMDLSDRELSAKRVRARKDYTCEHCNGAIPRNTLYYRSVFLHDGKIYSQRSHTGQALCGHDEYESDPTEKHT